MDRPLTLDEANTNLALLLDPETQTEDLARVYLDVQRAHRLPGSSTDARAGSAPINELRDATEIAND